MKEVKQSFYKLNWDNEFSVRFHIKDKPTALAHIPNNIFSVELPEIVASDIIGDEIDSTLKLTLRSTLDGSVEKEVFDTLLMNFFDINLSLSNPNKVTWQYNGCSVERIGFSQLVDRKSKSNPFNFTLYIKVSQIVYNGENAIIEFGRKPADLSVVETEKVE